MVTGREIRSTIDATGTLTLALVDTDIAAPGASEVIVRVEASPINPSDIGLLLGPADLATMEATGTPARPSLRIAVPKERLPGIRGRLGQAMAIGNEGAGTVIAAGEAVKALKGRRVAMLGGGMYADFRKIAASEVVPLPDGASAADGAAMFINPLTALGFAETVRAEGHRAAIQTAAASNLGQMFQRICKADGVPLINIVRSEEQVALLRSQGAAHVLNSRDERFFEDLTDLAAETGATIVFDAIGGGTLGGTILAAIEQAALRSMTTYSRYGSDAFKHLCIYGGLDPSPVILDRSGFGFQWSVSSWLLFPFLKEAGEAVAQRMRERVVNELTTTFASRYTRVIGLAEALQPDVVRAYERKATGEKFLIDPRRG